MSLSEGVGSGPGSAYRRALECVYVGAVGVLAVLGGVRADGHYYLAAIVLTLPVGLAAAVSVYGGYALIKGVGGLFTATTAADGDDAGWLTAASAAFDVLAFMAAALVLVLLLERRRRRSR